MSYTTTPTYVSSQIGYQIQISATLPAVLTNVASAAVFAHSAGFTVTAGSYLLSMNVNYIINSAVAGTLNNIVSGISTSNTAFAGGQYHYIAGYQNIPAGVSGQNLIYSITRIMTISTSGTYYIVSQPNYTGTTLALTTSLNYAMISRIG
jgi:hypothetical protein